MYLFDLFIKICGTRENKTYAEAFPHHQVPRNIFIVFLLQTRVVILKSLPSSILPLDVTYEQPCAFRERKRIEKELFKAGNPNEAKTILF